MQADAIETFLSRTTLRQVEVMIAVSRHNSMSKAADELGITVAAVSRMTKRFEGNVGIGLFAGSVRRSVLLDEGRAVIDHLKPLMQEISVLKTKLQAIEQFDVKVSRTDSDA